MSVHIVSHTSLRGIAAMAVFWGHYSDVFARDVGGWNLFVPHTHLGVDLFFMLSGFVLYHVYASQFLTGVTGPRWGAFMRQRLLRIYPLHLVTLVAVLVLMRFELPGDGLWILGLNLTLTHAWGLTDQFIFNAPSWSISAEFAAYLLFPFMVLATGTRAGRWGLGALAAVCGVWLLTRGGGSLDLAETGRRAVLLRVGLAFPIGVLLGWAATVRGPMADAEATRWQVGALVGLGVWLGAGLPEMGVIPLFAVLVYATAKDRGALARVLAWRPLWGLGVVSYGLYLLQWPVMLLMFNLEPKLAPYLSGLALDGARFAIVLGLMLGAAAASWRWFEAPLVALGRRRAARVATV